MGTSNILRRNSKRGSSATEEARGEQGRAVSGPVACGNRFFLSGARLEWCNQSAVTSSAPRKPTTWSCRRSSSCCMVTQNAPSVAHLLARSRRGLAFCTSAQRPPHPLTTALETNLLRRRARPSEKV